MRSFLAIMELELLKVRKSNILIGTLVFFIFISLIVGLFAFVVKHPEWMGKSAILGAKASMMENADWPSYFNLMIQIILTAGTFGFGITAAWIFGREFADHTIKDMLALPVSRISIVLGKFTVLMIWNGILALIVLGVCLLVGRMIGLEDWSVSLVSRGAIRFLVSALLTILLCTPIAFFASLSRGYLFPVGLIILTMIITQVAFVAFPSFTPCIPWAIPGLYSGVAGAIAKAAAGSYLILLLTCIAGIVGTTAFWRFADQV